MNKQREENLINQFIDKVEEDGKTGKDLTLVYIIQTLRKIINEKD